MNIYLNNDGQLDIQFESCAETAQDFLDACGRFYSKNPIGCETCPPSNHCCRQGLEIPADNVFLTKNAKGNLKRFVRNKLDMGDLRNQSLSSFKLKYRKACGWLSGLNRCTIYDRRPLACMIYQCRFPESERFVVMHIILRNLHTDVGTIQGISACVGSPVDEHFDSMDLSEQMRKPSFDIPLVEYLRWSLSEKQISREDELFDVGEVLAHDRNLYPAPFNMTLVKKCLLKELEGK
jgi:hypothetical protein